MEIAEPSRGWDSRFVYRKPVFRLCRGRLARPRILRARTGRSLGARRPSSSVFRPRHQGRRDRLAPLPARRAPPVPDGRRRCCQNARMPSTQPGMRSAPWACSLSISARGSERPSNGGCSGSSAPRTSNGAIKADGSSCRISGFHALGRSPTAGRNPAAQSVSLTSKAFSRLLSLCRRLHDIGPVQPRAREGAPGTAARGHQTDEADIRELAKGRVREVDAE